MHRKTPVALRKFGGMFGVKCRNKSDKEIAEWVLALDGEVADAALPEEAVAVQPLARRNRLNRQTERFLRRRA